MRSRHVRVYGLLLRLYPRRFRADYRREMTLLFMQQLADARSSGEPAGVLRLWIRTLFDLLATAPSEHLERDVLVRQPAVGLDLTTTAPSRSERARWIAAALAPGLIVAALAATAPRSIGPMFDKPPEALGLPLGAVIIGLSVGWYAIGVALVAWSSRNAVRLGAILLFVLPATFAMVLGPALIMMLQNIAAG